MVLTHSNLSIFCPFKRCGHSFALGSCTSWKFSYEITENWTSLQFGKESTGGQKEDENSKHTLEKVLGTCLIDIYLQWKDPWLFTWKPCSWHYHLISHCVPLSSAALKCWRYLIPDHPDTWVKRIWVWKKVMMDPWLRTWELSMFAELGNLQQWFFTEAEETLQSTFLYPV